MLHNEARKFANAFLSAPAPFIVWKKGCGKLVLWKPEPANVDAKRVLEFRMTSKISNQLIQQQSDITIHEITGNANTPCQ